MPILIPQHMCNSPVDDDRLGKLGRHLAVAPQDTEGVSLKRSCLHLLLLGSGTSYCPLLPTEGNHGE